MSAIDVTGVLPAAWDAHGAARRLGLFGAAWRRVLAAGLDACFGFCTRDGEPVALAVLFRRGPFRLAYADFPSGMSCPDGDTLQALSVWATRQRAAALRFEQPATAVADAGVLARLPVTRIWQLQDWSELAHAKAARSANRARRSPLRLRVARPADTAFIAGCYRSTVRRQDGSPRYPQRYFEALVEAAADDSGLRCLVAERADEPLAFHCSIRHGDTTFYLHGGSSDAGRSEYASDLLMLDSIRHARQEGCDGYDFLQSPAGQEGLLRYKQSWGGVTRHQQACERVLAPVQYRLLRTVQAAASGVAAWRQRLRRKQGRGES